VIFHRPFHHPFHRRSTTFHQPSLPPPLYPPAGGSTCRSVEDHRSLDAPGDFPLPRHCDGERAPARDADQGSMKMNTSSADTRSRLWAAACAGEITTEELYAQLKALRQAAGDELYPVTELGMATRSAAQRAAAGQEPKKRKPRHWRYRGRQYQARHETQEQTG
jgi:hypothetical protein